MSTPILFVFAIMMSTMMASILMDGMMMRGYGWVRVATSRA